MRGTILLGATALVGLLVGTGIGVRAEPGAATAGDEPQIVFGAGSLIAVIDPDGSDQMTLTEEGTDGSPSWSPDRSQIAFHSSRDDPNSDIFVMNADGSEETNLTGFRGPAQELFPAWSPLGDEIAMCANSPNRNGVWVLSPTGGSPRLVSRNAANCMGVAWSPDGSQIVYAQQFEVWIVNADGTGRRKLTRGAEDGFPDWSPDGTTIAFDRNDLGRRSGIFLVNVDGSGLHRLSPDGAFDMHPAWSPDGTEITFVRDPYICQIWIMNADGSDPRQVTQDLACNTAPDW